MKIVSYLMFNGLAEEAAKFYADALGGQVGDLYRYGEMPPMEGMPPVPEANLSWIMHGCVTFPGGTMAFADTLPNDPRSFGNGGHMLSLHCDSIGQTEAVFASLSAGGKVNCPLGEVFYAKRYGELVDRFGVLWGVICEEA